MRGDSTRTGKQSLPERPSASASVGFPNLNCQVERIGFALDLEDHQPDLHCVAVPWRENGEVRAALGLSGPSTRLPCDQLTDIAWMMMKEAKKVR